jgi:hypothetical protein
LDNKVTTKEAYRIFYMVKGHINTDKATVRACYPNYFKRCWYNQESWIRDEKFNEIWNEKKI